MLCRSSWIVAAVKEKQQQCVSRQIHSLQEAHLSSTDRATLYVQSCQLLYEKLWNDFIAMCIFLFSVFTVLYCSCF